MDTITLYHPLPFNIKATRNDSCERYEVIKKNYGSFNGKTLFELCCANGYFLFKFMQDGGGKAVGIERKQDRVDIVNGFAGASKINIKCHRVTNKTELPKTDEVFDVGLYLDTHYDTMTGGYLEYIKEHSRIAFISQSTGPNKDKLRSELKNLYSNIEKIHIGSYAKREMYKCTD